MKTLGYSKKRRGDLGLHLLDTQHTHLQSNMNSGKQRNPSERALAQKKAADERDEREAMKDFKRQSKWLPWRDYESTI